MFGLALLIAILLTSAALGWLIWENRGSEKLLGAVFGAVLTLVIAVVTLFMSTSASSFSESFGTTFLLDTTTQLPISVPPDLMPLSMPTAWVTAGAEATDRRWAKDDAGGRRLYHHVLQRAVLNFLTMHYSNDWRMKIDRFATGLGTMQHSVGHPGDIPKGRTITEAELKNAFAQSPFIDMPPLGAKLQIGVPPGMRMTVRVPNDSNTDGLISFHNRY